MPELPEVETVRRGLNRVSLSLTITGGELLLSRTLAAPAAEATFWEGLIGTQLREWHRRGKYLLGELVSREQHPRGWLVVHLRMTGKLLWVHPNQPLTAHCRTRFFLGDQHEVRFEDQRTFGRIWWVAPQMTLETVVTGLARLGPEPFADDFSLSYLQGALKNSRRPIKNALLDQALVAGIGNIYADEALFLSGIRPTVLAGKLRRQRLQRLHAAIRAVLTKSIESGGTTFSDYRDIYGVNGNYAGVAWVYGRTGEPCRNCQRPIQRLVLVGRSAHYCPHCQRA